MIEQLINEENELLTAISENKRKQKEYYTNLFCEKYKIKIGDTISYKEGKDNKDIVVGVLDHFQYSDVHPYAPVVLLFNSDGKVGKREKKCWYSSLETIEVVQSV